MNPLRSIDQEFREWARYTSRPEFYRKACWLSVGIGIVMLITLAFAPHYLMK